MYLGAGCAQARDQAGANVGATGARIAPHDDDGVLAAALLRESGEGPAQAGHELGHQAALAGDVADGRENNTPGSTWSQNYIINYLRQYAEAL